MNKKMPVLPGKRRMIPVMLLCWLACLCGCETRAKPEAVPASPSFASQSFATLIEKVSPAVVNISTTSTVTIPGTPFHHFFGPGQGAPFHEFFNDDFMRRFFEETPQRQMKRQSLGSGVIIDEGGYIVTNNHVVEKADEIKVKLSDTREFLAKVIGRDAKTDLALIRILPGSEKLPTLNLGDSGRARVGDLVLAVGNPFGLEQTVTQGIISATGRAIGAGPYDDFVQTDAAINPGNSGGPLINLNGEVVGIATAIFAGGQGLGFAIPSSLVKSVTAELKEKGKVVRGWLGVAVQPVSAKIAKAFGMKEARGALVGQVIKDSPADKGGIKTGDVIVSFDGKPVQESDDLPRMVAEAPVGKSVVVSVFRRGKEIPVTIKLAEMPAEKVPAPLKPGPALENFGMKLDNLTPRWRRQFRITEESGVIVVAVEPGSPAFEAGIRPGDVVKEVDRSAVGNLAEFNKSMGKSRKEQPVLLLLSRGAQSFFVTLEPQGD